MPAVPSGLIESQERRWREQAATVAHGLRRMADEVEREANQSANLSAPEWGWRAQQVIHTVMWGVANLSLDQLALLATEIDVIKTLTETDTLGVPDARH